MSNTLKIAIPEGFRAASFDAKTGEIKLEEIPKDIKERIQSVDDIFALNNTTQEEFDDKWEDFEEHEKAGAFEKLIVAAYNDNDGKLPDFTDGTSKYYPIFKMGSPAGVGFSYGVCVSWSSDSVVGARLVFYGPEAKANMLDAVNKFLKQYKQSRTS